MELVRGVHNLASRHRGCVLTIGKFDGVHLGHQAVLRQLRTQSNAMGLSSAVMVFEPQPEEVFTPNKAPARLSTLRDKVNLLSAQGIERLICIRFDAKFAAQSAEQFIRELLVDKLGIRFLVVGDDFKFGRKRAGDFTMLQQAGKKYGFDVVSTASFCLNHSRISSTAIRTALASDDFNLSTEMLGRDFAFSGKVVHGNKQGRTIGFPTANLMINRVKTPIQGVFAVTVNIGARRYYGVANIGNRPTINGQRMLLEVHVFDFSKQIYGQRIDVVPLYKIRNEMKFASFEALKQQIAIDAKVAKQKLNTMFDEVMTEPEN